MKQLRAIIDIGSNTVRTVVYNGPPRAPIVVLNEKVTPRLGRDVSQTGLLSEKSMESALGALSRYSALLKLMEVGECQTVATAAVRDAANGPEFLEAVAGLGLSPRLLSGEEEARASATGVIAAFPGATGFVGDLGGGSLELIPIANGTTGEGITLPFGTLRLPPLREKGAKSFIKHVATALKQAGWTEGEDEAFYIVGGSWRALALYAMHRLEWPLEDPHNFELPSEALLPICQELASGEFDTTVPRISSGRIATLPDAAALLEALIRAIRPARIVFSSWGLREGLLHASLDEPTQALDPVVASIGAFVERYDVEPAKAQDVCAWIADVLPEKDHEDRTRRLASAMLAMAAMREEPNVRVEEVMNWVLGKRWIGLDARGRALVAMIVLANLKCSEPPEELAGLAGITELEEAVAIGLAIRLCRKLTGFTRAAMEESSVGMVEGRLVLQLGEAAVPLLSSSVEKNLHRLAEWLSVEAEVRTD